MILEDARLSYTKMSLPHFSHRCMRYIDSPKLLGGPRILNRPYFIAHMIQQRIILCGI